MTKLTKFEDAYATMTVAVYEPIIMHWWSWYTFGTLATVLAKRAVKAKALGEAKLMGPTAFLLATTGSGTAFAKPAMGEVRYAPAKKVADLDGALVDPEETGAVKLEGAANAQRVGGVVYPHGVAQVVKHGTQTLAGAQRIAAQFGLPADGQLLVADRQPEVIAMQPGSAELPALQLPLLLSRHMGAVGEDFEYHETKQKLATSMFKALQTAVANKTSVREAVTDVLLNQHGLGTGHVFDFLPPFGEWHEALSPIGIVHFYRQLYFNTIEGYGPVEEAFTIAPLETFEVVLENVRRQIHEEQTEMGLEVVSESATESKNLDEISDKVSSMVQRDFSAGMSANVSGGIGVWQVGASANFTLGMNSQNSKEIATRRLQEVTKRASERITKSYAFKTRDLTETVTTSMTRRVIKNDGADPVSYGLRRVMRKVNVKVQDLGPSLVWQLYVRNPGRGLARSRFVHFREEEQLAVPDIPPGVPPRPKGSMDGGQSTSAITIENGPDGVARYWVTIKITVGSDRQVTAITIDQISDLSEPDKEDASPSPVQGVPTPNPVFNAATNTWLCKAAVAPGNSYSVSVTYTYRWDPSKAVMDEWEAQRKAAVAVLTQQAMTEQFERSKQLITKRSKIRPRPANDLRREERYEVMNRMVSTLFAHADNPSVPSPLEIEYFHRYFDIDMMFVYNHPSWWKPRYGAGDAGAGRPAYEITEESDTAPMGSSLGWLLQLDGDTRRNEFINSPWVRVCLPMRAGREREAIAWLAKHVEGEVGYDPVAEPLAGLLASIEEMRVNQKALGVDGPEYVKVDSTVGAPADPLSPQGIYPIVQTFDAVVPTDGFVYDRLTMV